MEEYDDVTAGPDENGALNLSFNSWPKVPYEVFTFSNKLIKLNLNNNKLAKISSDFGSMVLLQGEFFYYVKLFLTFEELNVSYNRIEIVDDSISNCIRLKYFNISNNELVSMPDGLYKCVMLVGVIIAFICLFTFKLNQVGDSTMPK